jgi:hypothetical protein
MAKKNAKVPFSSTRTDSPVSSKPLVSKEFTVNVPTSLFHAGKSDARKLHADFDLFKTTPAYKEFLMSAPGEKTIRVCQGIFSVLKKSGFLLHGVSNHWLAPVRFFNHVLPFAKSVLPFFNNEKISNFGNLSGKEKGYVIFLLWQGAFYDENIQMNIDLDDDEKIDWQAIGLLYSSGALQKMMSM